MAANPPEELRGELLSVIAAGTGAPLADADFDRLARAVFAHQFACNQPYRLFCERLSGQAVQDFMDKYPATDAPERNIR